MLQLKPLTSIRFVFAMFVVLFHGLDFLKQSHIATNWPAIILDVISHGYIGVDFFFVLSGFILSYSYQNRLGHLRDNVAFWWARFARIYPAYLFAFTVFLPIAIYSAALSGQSGFAVVTAAFQLTLTQSWIPATALQWNIPAWSLSVEAFFYALFPFVLLRAHLLSKRHLVFLAIGAYTLSQIGALVGWYFGPTIADSFNSILGFRELSPNDRDLFPMYFPMFRLPEFLFGTTLGILFSRMPPLPTISRKIALLTGCIGSGIGVVAIAPHLPDGMISNGLLMPFLGLVLFGLAYSKSKMFGHPLFVLLGDASYSVYLLHIPLWTWMQRTDFHLTHIQTSTPKIFFVLYLTSLICISLLSLKFIETPARRLIRDQLQPRPSLSDVKLRSSA
jgi:peptidoglycan/LPS O-acetylase OafA/YrhL